MVNRPPTGKVLRRLEAPHALPADLERRFYTRGDAGAGPMDGVIRWCVDRFMGVNKDEDCRVGFFYDKQRGTCTPICKPGYVYDPVLKKCLGTDEAFRS
jgi:hypothetical protein